MRMSSPLTIICTSGTGLFGQMPGLFRPGLPVLRGRRVLLDLLVLQEALEPQALLGRQVMLAQLAPQVRLGQQA